MNKKRAEVDGDRQVSDESKEDAQATFLNLQVLHNCSNNFAFLIGPYLLSWAVAGSYRLWPTRFDMVFSQQTGLSTSVDDIVDSRYRNHSQSEANGELVASFSERLDSIRILKGTDLFKRLFGYAAIIDSCFDWWNSMFAVQFSWQKTIIVYLLSYNSVFVIVLPKQKPITVYLRRWRSLFSILCGGVVLCSSVFSILFFALFLCLRAGFVDFPAHHAT